MPETVVADFIAASAVMREVEQQIRSVVSRYQQVVGD